MLTQKLSSICLDKRKKTSHHKMVCGPILSFAMNLLMSLKCTKGLENKRKGWTKSELVEVALKENAGWKSEQSVLVQTRWEWRMALLFMTAWCRLSLKLRILHFYTTKLLRISLSLVKMEPGAMCSWRMRFGSEFCFWTWAVSGSMQVHQS